MMMGEYLPESLALVGAGSGAVTAMIGETPIAV